MGKKNKKNLKQLAEKRQTLQFLRQSTPSSSMLTAGLPQRPLVPELPTTLGSANALPAWHVHKELLRTIISVAIIAVLFVLVVIIDNQQPFLQTLGDQMYQWLRLDS